MSDEFENEFIDHDLKRGSQRFAYTDPATGEKKIGYGEVPLPHGEYPVDMDLEDEEAMAQYDLDRFKIRGVNVLKYSPQDFEDIRSQDEGTQLTDPAWIASSKILYRTTENKAFEGEDKDVAQWGLDFMDRFEANLPAMLVNTNTVLQAPTPVQSAMYYLMETYDRKGLDLRSTLRQVAWSLADPSNLFGLGTLGVGFVAKGGAKRLSKAGFKTLLKESILSKPNLGTILTGFDAAAVTAAYDAARQNIEIGAGVREEFDPTQTAIASGIGLAAGDRLAAGTPVIVESARRAGTGVAEAVTEKAGQVYEGVENLTNLNVVPPKRVGTTGQYVGAPRGIDTPQKLAGLTRKLEKAAVEGKVGKFWYESSSDAILDVVNGDVDEADKLIQAIAVTSSGTPVESNFNFAVQAYFQHKEGQPIKTGMFPKAMSKKLTDIFEGRGFRGAKTSEFYKNLMVNIDPSRVQGSTIDIWMMRAFGYKKEDGSPIESPTEAQYKFAEEQLQKIADRLGWRPHQVQAAVWTMQKAKTQGLDLDDAKFDYSNAIKNSLGQISWETKPSASSNHLRQIFDAPMEQQSEFHVAMSKVFLDDAGKDTLAEKAGVISPGHFEAPGYFEGVVSPGTQTNALLPTKYKGDKKLGKVVDLEPAALDSLRVYMAARGILLKQDGMGAHRPVYFKKLTRPKANALRVEIGRMATTDEIADLAELLAKLSGSTDLNPIPYPDGVRLINFTNLPNKEFHEICDKALGEWDVNDVKYASKAFFANTEYLGNNWKENANGEGYVYGDYWSERPDLVRRVESLVKEFNERVEDVEQRFTDKYGWERRTEYNSKYRGQQEEAAEQIAPSPDTDPSVLGERPPQPPALEDP